MNTCHYCSSSIFWINHIPFEDPEGSVRHKCMNKNKLSTILSDKDKINAIYNFTVKIKLALDVVQQRQDEIIKKIGEFDARK